MQLLNSVKSMNKILLFGKHGQIGSELIKLLTSWNLIALGRNDINIFDYKAVEETVNNLRPEIIVNTTAYNDVDGAEVNPALAMQINVYANEFLARLSARHNVTYITYSSDFVFDGRKGTPYLETDTPNPINKYGDSKLRGDIAVQNSGVNHFIFRTSSVYSLNRPCFLTKIIRQAKRKNIMHVRSDLVNCPTSAQFIAQATAFLIKNYRSELYKYGGLYNLCSSGSASRHQWAQAISKKMNLGVKIIQVDGLDQGGAPRPAYSSLDNELFQSNFDLKIPDWEEMLYTLLEN